MNGLPVAVENQVPWWCAVLWKPMAVWKRPPLIWRSYFACKSADSVPCRVRIGLSGSVLMIISARKLSLGDNWEVMNRSNSPVRKLVLPGTPSGY
jgi:hypothetical protein